MLRLSVSILLIAFAVVASGSEPKGRFDGIWLFDGASSYPGVTMMEVATHGGRTTGAVTTTWYGPIDMQNVKVDGNVATFDMRNVNDNENLTRRWTATLSSGKVTVTGEISRTHVEQAGRIGTSADAQARTFRFVDLPPTGTIQPDNLAPTPPMGWNSWNKFATAIDDKTVRAMADSAVSSGLREAGYVYLNIDDGWEGPRDANGKLQPNEKFPDMKALADYVHSRGLKLGIYSSPGPKTCAGYTGSYGHVTQDAQTFAEWGIDYLKYDLCSGEWFYSDAAAVKRAYYAMGVALKATGRPIIYSLCEYGRFDVGAWGRDVGGHLWRTSGDISDDYHKMARIGFERNGNPTHTGPGGWNDPDMLEIGNGGMSADEYRTHMALWAMSAAPLIMGHDLRTTSAIELSILATREVIAVDQDAKGIQGHSVYKDGTSEIWVKPLMDGSVAVALFNRGDAGIQMQLQPADAGFAAVTSIYDLWRGAAVKADATMFNVPAHGVTLLKIRGRS
jgi:alpha-galactosidase